MVKFDAKKSQFLKILESSEQKFWCKFTAICYIFQIFGMCFGHLVYSLDVWCIFHILVHCTKENLATLRDRNRRCLAFPTTHCLVQQIKDFIVVPIFQSHCRWQVSSSGVGNTVSSILATCIGYLPLPVSNTGYLYRILATSCIEYLLLLVSDTCCLYRILAASCIEYLLLLVSDTCCLYRILAACIEYLLLISNTCCLNRILAAWIEYLLLVSNTCYFLYWILAACIEYLLLVSDTCCLHRILAACIGYLLLVSCRQPERLLKPHQTDDRSGANRWVTFSTRDQC
jgi:hypothetical protein